MFHFLELVDPERTPFSWADFEELGPALKVQNTTSAHLQIYIFTQVLIISYLKVHMGTRIFTTNLVGYSRTSFNLLECVCIRSLKFGYRESTCRSVSIAALVPWNNKKSKWGALGMPPPQKRDFLVMFPKCQTPPLLGTPRSKNKRKWWFFKKIRVFFWVI